MYFSNSQTPFSYLYCLHQNPMKNNHGDFKYLSIRKLSSNLNFQKGEIVLLLLRNGKESVPGIIGYCVIADSIKTTSQLPITEKKYCYKESFFQLPVTNINCSPNKNIIDEDELYSLPYMNNQIGKLRVYTKFNIINLGSGFLDILESHRKYWFVWRAERTKNEIVNYKTLFVHKRRELIDYKLYKKLIKGIKKCEICGFEKENFLPYTPRFFEFHELGVDPLNPKYQKINYKNFIPLCPNCHKIQHEQIVEESFKNKEYGYLGYSMDYLACGWNTELYNKEFTF